MYNLQIIKLWKIYSFLLLLGFNINGCSPYQRLPLIDVEEEDNHDFISVKNNILQGSIKDIDKNIHDELEINPWMYKYKDGKKKFYIAVIHDTNEKLYTSSETSLKLIVDGETFYWDTPEDKVRESYLYNTNIKTGEKTILHYYGINYFSLSQDQFTKLCQAKDIKVQSIGNRKSTNWSFGLLNFQIIQQFYKEHFF